VRGRRAACAAPLCRAFALHLRLAERKFRILAVARGKVHRRTGGVRASRNVRGKCRGIRAARGTERDARVDHEGEIGTESHGVRVLHVPIMARIGISGQQENRQSEKLNDSGSIQIRLYGPGILQAGERGTLTRTEPA